MSEPHDRNPADVRQSRSSTVGDRCRVGRFPAGLPRPTRNELATIWSVPIVLLLVHFLVQPLFDGWVRLKYVRYSVAQTVPAQRIAPESLTPYAWAWHELTRIAHALVHAPSPYHTHVVGNVALVVLAAWALLVVLSALGQRRWFVFYYWELVVVAPVVGSFAFDLFGQTPTGYGASTVGFAFLGVLVVVSVVALLRGCSALERPRATRPVQPDGGRAVSPFVVVGFLCVAVGLVVSDLIVGSPAMAVHQTGVGFGILVGAVAVPLTRWV